MPIIDTRGVTLQGPIVNIAAAATGTAVFQRSTFAQQLGTRTMCIKRLLVQNLAAGDQWFALGVGLGGAFVPSIPYLRILNNLDNEWGEDDLPNVEWFADMTASLIAIAVGGAVNVQVQIEEKG
jgi:hypothetical protein